MSNNSDPFYIVSCYIKWVETSWTDRIVPGGSFLIGVMDPDPCFPKTNLYRLNNQVFFLKLKLNLLVKYKREVAVPVLI